MRIYTSYLSKANKVIDKGMIPVAIVRYLPKNVKMDNITALSPSPQLLKKYKQDSDETYYTQSFTTYLKSLDVKNIITKLKCLSIQNGNKDLVLICYEKSTDFCHRHIVADWINNADILTHKIVELEL